MMYQKACHFHDEEIANDILHTDNVAEIKKLGRKVHNYCSNFLYEFALLTGFSSCTVCAFKDFIL